MRVLAQGMPPTPSRVSELAADDARRAGAASTAALVDRLPFTQVRSARGASAVSLRGARREQVVVTLDGLPLNDPSTGVADLSDIPLVALGSASVMLGADPLGAGPGASGGVLSLSTAADRLLAVRAGALGQRSLEGAWNGLVGPTLARVSARHGVAQNDFLFDNDAGVSPVRERRINNDRIAHGGHCRAHGTDGRSRGSRRAPIAAWLARPTCAPTTPIARASIACCGFVRRPTGLACSSSAAIVAFCARLPRSQPSGA